MKKILVINNNIDPPYTGATDIVRNLEKQIPKFGKAEITVQHAPGDELKHLFHFDAVCISGSKTRAFETFPWVLHQMEFIRELYKRKIPTLGICYGEQIIARALAGDSVVAAAKQGEFGWGRIELFSEAKKSKIFHSLPESFFSFQFHQDEVLGHLPKPFQVLARSVDCAVQAYEVIDAPMWATQFHHEKALEDGNASLERVKKNNPERRILNQEKSSELYSDAIGDTIFYNFLKVVWQIP